MTRPSIMIPWYIAKATKAAIAPIIIALECQGVFWDTWAQVYRGDS